MSPKAKTKVSSAPTTPATAHRQRHLPPSCLVPPCCDSDSRTHACIQSMHLYACIQSMHRYACIQSMHRYACIQSMHRYARIQSMHRYACIQSMHRYARIQSMHRYARIHPFTHSLQEHQATELRAEVPAERADYSLNVYESTRPLDTALITDGAMPYAAEEEVASTAVGAPDDRRLAHELHKALMRGDRSLRRRGSVEN